MHPEANIIFGATIDDALGDEVRVTVIAAGFDGGMPKRAKEGSALRRTAPAQTQAETLNAARALSEAKKAEPAPQSSREPVTASAPATSAPAAPPRPYAFDDDDLDVPDFLK